MDFQRIILFSALAFTLLMIWQAWQEDYVRPKTVATEVRGENDTPTLPQASGTTEQVADAPSITAVKSSKRVSVETDLFSIEIDTQGGDLRRVDLKKYPVSSDKPDQPFRLMDDEATVFIAQSGLLASQGSGSAAPSHHQIYSVASDSYRLADDQESMEVRLGWSDVGGVKVDKVYTFYRGKYSIDVRFEIDNRASSEWKGHMYSQLVRNKPVEESSLFIHTYTGGVIYSQEEKYEKIDFGDMDQENLKRKITGGWAAMIQHYFLTAWIPSKEEGNSYYSKVPGDGRYILGMIGAPLSVAAGERVNLNTKLFVGPKLQDELEQLAEGLELTVDYGILTILAKPLFWLLKIIHGVTDNWGWAIIFLTVMIKAAFYKLSETSYKSMAQMRKLQPKLKSLKENYGDDKQKMNEAMMKMYREEKINPLGGCLPILVQIPVFIALYWMLLESVEIRQQPFMLWITDLTAQDPYYILPVLMGATMLIQHKLNPTPLDPIQARVMMILPIAFTFFFLFFPAGLVLYWVVNNTLSIAQQWYITRVVIGTK
ncbi:MAG: membrane protein insertase YidC [Pseudomonadota bacterium]